MAKLFTPIRIGALELEHRVVLAPLTRMRSVMPGNVPGATMAEYYKQRASQGGLLIAEAAFISRQGNGGYASPGIESDEQMHGWRRVVDTVHAEGARFLLQLWHVGRSSHTELQPGGGQPIAPSAIENKAGVLLQGGYASASPARAIATREIPDIVDQYRRAAERTREAGFDGVEIHAANGYLIDQFLQDGSNKREDSYGGSIANRARFLLQVVEGVVAVWGADRVGVRIGPSNSFNDMHDSDPRALFTYVAKALGQRGLAYLHVIEPRVTGNNEVGDQTPVAASLMKSIFGGPVIAAGGFDGAGAEAIIAEGGADLVAFGRHFIANPDLPDRLRRQLPLNPYDRKTFYYGGNAGYLDYSVHGKRLAIA